MTKLQDAAMSRFLDIMNHVTSPPDLMDGAIIAFRSTPERSVAAVVQFEVDY